MIYLNLEISDHEIQIIIMTFLNPKIFDKNYQKCIFPKNRPFELK